MAHRRIDSHCRSVIKAVSWRFLATTITVCVAWTVTGQATFAAKIGVVDTLLKLAVYYGHERVWSNVKLGRAHPPEYEI